MMRNVQFKLNLLILFTPPFFCKSIILEVHTQKNIVVSKQAGLTSFETTTRVVVPKHEFRRPYEALRGFKPQRSSFETTMMPQTTMIVALSYAMNRGFKQRFRRF